MKKSAVRKISCSCISSELRETIPRIQSSSLPVEESFLSYTYH